MPASVKKIEEKKPAAVVLEKKQEEPKAKPVAKAPEAPKAAEKKEAPKPAEKAPAAEPKATKPVAEPAAPVAEAKPAPPKPTPVITTGVIRVTELKAKGLVCKDKFSSGDPYLVFSAGKKEHTTKTMSGKNPVFKDTLDVTVTDGNAQLEIKAMDWDRFSAHDLIGKVTVPVSNFRGDVGRLFELSITKQGKHGSQGTVMFRTTWVPDATN